MSEMTTEAWENATGMVSMDDGEAWAEIAARNAALLITALAKLAAAERERDALTGLLKLTNEKLAETKTKLSEENIAWLRLDSRWRRVLRWAWRYRRKWHMAEADNEEWETLTRESRRLEAINVGRVRDQRDAAIRQRDTARDLAVSLENLVHEARADAERVRAELVATAARGLALEVGTATEQQRADDPGALVAEARAYPKRDLAESARLIEVTADRGDTSGLRMVAATIQAYAADMQRLIPRLADALGRQVAIYAEYGAISNGAIEDMRADRDAARAEADEQRQRAQQREQQWGQLAVRVLEIYHVNSARRPFHDRPFSECTELLCVNYRREIAALAALAARDPDGQG